MAHTPGPWKCKIGEDGRQSEIVTKKDDDFLIASAVCEGINQAVRQQDIANARLIAAAPELLETLTELYEFTERIHGDTLLGKPIRVKAKRLIERLKGEA